MDKEFYELLFNNRLISSIWQYVLELVEEQLLNEQKKEQYLVLFTIYFSLIDDGNTCMSLNENTLSTKWNEKLKSTKILLEENGKDVASDFMKIEEISNQVISNVLKEINEQSLPMVIGKDKIFVVESEWLYLRKYDFARKSIASSIARLFKNDYPKSQFDYKDCIKDTFHLSKGQDEAVVSGITKNLIITGGPGTGKTTSILFLLLGLLSDPQKKYEVHLIAPSGKASSRMKDSIINGLSSVKDEYKQQNPQLISTISNLEESTIHRLLSPDFKTSCYRYHKNHQFSENSIFIIDEASMIDICLFHSLLEAIPDEARVFIMGDKNQLPSVECGAVFAELLENEALIAHGNIVKLDESRRFSSDTKIFELAKAINEGEALPVEEKDWKDSTQFTIEADDKTKPIFYYYLDPDNKKTIIRDVATKWAKEYYASLQEQAMNLDGNNLGYLTELFDLTEKAKILCAENEGASGVKGINQLIKDVCIDKSLKTSIDGQYAGQIMMINTNNKLLDLYNGDSGILVTLKGNNTVYFMVKKSSLLIKEDGMKEDGIFKMGDFIFYPLRLIRKSEIDLAYAITIHKSQGSDYRNILVLLPTKKGHPLLNRQIVYTAITRTKGNTYILASQSLLEEARDHILTRDTRINE